MDEKHKMQSFESVKIRTAWDEEQQEWFISIVDVIAVLTDQPNQRSASTYWAVLKKRLKQEGSELLTDCKQLKLIATDGKKRLTDVADTRQILRIIQSVPSPKAEPFKIWLAQIGKERIDETIDPEQAIDRALDTYLKKGYSEEWIQQRLLSIRIRNNLTTEWNKHGISHGLEYAILTDEITKAWAGLTTREYKNLKKLTRENLRDNMTDLELVLTMLAEATTTEISKNEDPQTFEENRKIAFEGGSIAGTARKQIEQRTGNPVVTADNAFNIASLLQNSRNENPLSPQSRVKSKHTQSK